MKRNPTLSLFVSVVILVLMAFVPVKRYNYKVVQVLPHFTTSYTQGLFFHEGFMYESTGQYGRSLMAKVDIPSGQMLQSVALPNQYFGEGACLFNGLIYQLTWEEQTCLIYDLKTLRQVGTLHYPGEGWGLTTDGKQLIMSDGSSVIRFCDASTLLEQRAITVKMDGKPVDYLNELEYIEGEIWANVYTRDIIVRIDPKSGEVTGVIDLKDILPRSLRKPSTDVLNGIAYDPLTKSIWVTGKNWPKMYKITVQ